MSNPTFKLALIAALTLFASCRETPKNEDPNRERMEAIIAIHDEVMPEMGTIAKLVAQLKPLADSIEAGAPYRVAMEDLQQAHESMMDWMKNFGDRFNYEEIKGIEPISPEKQDWIREEEESVQAMKEQVFGSIERAKALLDSVPAP
ncbi:hypothetical protein OZ410_05280 [Robiginitalea sp. M366]|uniref:hypothetical protein n=1 Tax=Robiginitalea aestuariiviva TaxID=3036903 RepID=UPI00240DCCA5|nr:hypothetical protein [Robiginitalea aestuariiviva]MDG1571717.1 hypothetical protein [Robiginitalea aestuariiviva]